MQNSESERRNASRVEVRIPARYSSSAISLSGEVENLSSQGLFLRSQYLDEEGARVELTVMLPGEEAPVQLNGEVVRVVETPTASGMGIRFRGLHPLAKRRLANYMIERRYQ